MHHFQNSTTDSTEGLHSNFSYVFRTVQYYSPAPVVSLSSSPSSSYSSPSSDLHLVFFLLFYFLIHGSKAGLILLVWLTGYFSAPCHQLLGLLRLCSVEQVIARSCERSWWPKISPFVLFLVIFILFPLTEIVT
jgi:hypothetical protein